MAIFTVPELLDMVIMSACLGYIFSGYLSKFNNLKRHDDLNSYYSKRVNWGDFVFSLYIVVPSIILHELGHKFTAMSFGYDATFFSALSINKLIHGMPFFDFASILMIAALISAYFGSMFFFFVPAYVMFSSMATPFQQTLIAFAGPFVNLMLWLIPKWLISSGKVKSKYLSFAAVTSRWNMILFLFNMLPLPGADGFKVYYGLFQLLFH